MNVVEALINAGSEIELTDNAGRTALSWAIKGGQFTVKEELLKHGALSTRRNVKRRNIYGESQIGGSQS